MTNSDFARVVATPENHLALAALKELAEALRSSVSRHLVSPIYIYGPPGGGKSFLLSSLESELHSARVGRRVVSVQAKDFDEMTQAPEAVSLDQFVQADLLLLEDLHLLRVRSGELQAAASDLLARLLDDRQALNGPVVATGSRAPCDLDYLPARLRGRLAAGAHGCLPARRASRLLILEKFAQRRQLASHADAWLAENLNGSGRVLEGAITRLAELSRRQARPIDLEAVRLEFRPEAESGAMTVEQIADRVSDYFRIDSKQLKSRRRFSRIQVPRQVTMYLIRQLTSLSFEEIGTHFGGRDHSTVLHACKKIERSLAAESELTTAVHHLHRTLEASLCKGRS